jgi:HD-like signal output (HDOD) protein
MSNNDLVTSDEILKKIMWAISPKGDFPVSARIVQELLTQLSNPNSDIKDISNTILKEPSLAARVLILVNSVFYNRSTKIVDLKSAIIQIGTNNLVQLCCNLVLLQKFIPLARKNDAFAHSLSNALLTIIINDQLQYKFNTQFKRDDSDCELLCGSFVKLGQLLLSFYFPDLYYAAIKRSEQKQLTISDAIFELTGISIFKLSCMALSALKIPSYFTEAIAECGKINQLSNSGLSQIKSCDFNVSLILYIANKLADNITAGSDRISIQTLCEMLEREYRLPASEITQILANLNQLFTDYCSSLNLVLPKLPSYLLGIDKSLEKVVQMDNRQILKGKPIVTDLRISIQNGETGHSIIAKVLELLVFKLKFKRAYYFTVNKYSQVLELNFNLGNFNEEIDLKSLKIEISSKPQLLPVIAWKSKMPEFIGHPITEGYWPIVAFSIKGKDIEDGVIYAEKDAVSSEKKLSQIDEATIILISEIIELV